jgi:hypothetical protein
MRRSIMPSRSRFVIAQKFLEGLFMKKIVSLLVALALCATTAFAAPLSVAASFVEPVTAQTVSAGANADLFADVAAVPLTDSEAQAVEGEGVFGAIFTVLTVASSSTGGGFIADALYTKITGTDSKTGVDYAFSVVGGAMLGGVIAILAFAL